jgi:hypothetical protein
MRKRRQENFDIGAGCGLGQSLMAPYLKNWMHRRIRNEIESLQINRMPSSSK